MLPPAPPPRWACLPSDCHVRKVHLRLILKHWNLDLSQQQKRTVTDTPSARPHSGLAPSFGAGCGSLAEPQVKKLACVSGSTKLPRGSKQLRLHNEGWASKPENRHSRRGGGQGLWTQPTPRLIPAPLGNGVRATSKSISGDVVCGPPLTKLPSFLHKAKGRERVSLTAEPRTVGSPREKGVSPLLAPF